MGELKRQDASSLRCVNRTRGSSNEKRIGSEASETTISHFFTVAQGEQKRLSCIRNALFLLFVRPVSVIGSFLSMKRPEHPHGNNHQCFYYFLSYGQY